MSVADIAYQYPEVFREILAMGEKRHIALRNTALRQKKLAKTKQPASRRLAA